jgi:hypothetical protein
MAKVKTDGGYATEETQQDILAAIGPGPAAEPVKFRRDGAIQEVTEDTGTPANNRPMPVKLTYPISQSLWCNSRFRTNWRRS